MLFFAEAFFLGLLFNAAPGIVFTETIKRGISGGFMPALNVQIGSLAGDALWAILGLLGIGVLLNIDILKIPLSLAGIIYLIYLAYDSFRSSNIQNDNFQATETLNNSALKSGVMLSITNPQNIAYWAALGSSFSALGVNDPELSHYFIFFFGFITSSILWCFICAYSVDKIFKYANSLLKKYIFRICSVTFLYLALGTFYKIFL